MFYMEALLRWGFGTIEVGFLPVVHNHSDIDQACRTKYRILHTRDAVTMTDLQTVLSACYNYRAVVTSMRNYAKWSRLGDQAGVIVPVNNNAAYRYFQFEGNTE